ncbi:MAG: hypothetical protein A4E53_03589 [Pelotomaculum sp. PtaB.Bin104]|nr:MAG: hypothetical protein A4E53_03589 [Pelotomaculum sp. PtaB.Bin104]
MVILCLTWKDKGQPIRLPLLSPAESRQALRSVSTVALSSWRERAITADELKAKMESGKKLKEIVTEQGMTMEQFHEKMLELKKAEIAQKVADGKITQEQANKMLQKLDQRKGQGNNNSSNINQ